MDEEQESGDLVTGLGFAALFAGSCLAAWLLPHFWGSGFVGGAIGLIGAGAFYAACRQVVLAFLPHAEPAGIELRAGVADVGSVALVAALFTVFLVAKVSGRLGGCSDCDGVVATVLVIGCAVVTLVMVAAARHQLRRWRALP